MSVKDRNRGYKGHPRRISEMTRQLTRAFGPAANETFYEDRAFYRVERRQFRRKRKMNKLFYRTKYLVYIICLITCLNQLIKFIALYFSYKTSVDAQLMVEPNPQLPGITVCYNSLDDVLQFVSEKEYHVDMIRKCAFRFFNNTDNDKPRQDCVSAWAFNGDEPCVVINAEWAKPLNNEGGYSEFRYGVEGHVYQKQGDLITLGVEVFVHSPKDIPTRRISSYFIPLSTVNKGNFKKTVVYRLEPPYETRCFNYTKINRQTGEFKIISQQTCYYDCIWKYHEETCGCIATPLPFILPYKACNRSTKANCKRDMASWITTCNYRCPVACVMDFYEFGMTKLVTVSYLEYFKSYVEVFHELRDNVVVTFTHKPLITSLEVFSNIGGYLGIWLGMSVPLLYDILLYATFILIKSVSTVKDERQRSTNIQ